MSERAVFRRIGSAAVTPWLALDLASAALVEGRCYCDRARGEQVTDRFRPLGDPAGHEWIDPIQKELEDTRWEPVIGPGSRFVDHRFDNENGRLRVAYYPTSRSLSFAFQAGEVGGELWVTLPADYRLVLEVVLRHQNTLSVETWPAFIEQLMSVSPKVLAVAEDEDEDDIELTSAEMGASILCEGEWVADDDE